MATRLKQLTPGEFLESAARNRFRNVSFSMKITEAAVPATLKVLLGEVQVIVRPQNSSDRDASGICFLPSYTISPWISSDSIHTPYFSQISPAFRSSSSVKQRPSGFWGLQNIHIRQPRIFTSKSAQSNSYRPFVSTMGLSTVTLSFFSMTSKNGS